MKISRAILWAALLLTSLPFAGGAARAEEPPIVIGFAIAQSGWFAPNDSVSDAAELAIQDVNAKGGVLGRKLVTVYADTKSDRVEAAKAALEVLGKGADLVIVSCDYDMGGPAALAAAKAGKIAWSLCAEESRIGRLGPYVFTIGPPTQSIGAAVAEWGYKEKGLRNLFVLLDDTLEYTREVCFGMTTAWKGLPGAKIVGSDSFKNGDPSIATQIAHLKNTKPAPDAIALCTYPPGGINVVRQLGAAGVTLPVLANDAMDGGFWLNAVPNLKDFYVPTVGSVYGDDPRPEINDVYKRLKEKTGKPPVFGYSYVGYADIQLWARAVERAKTLDAKAVTDVLEKFNGEPSLIGPVTFSKDLHITTKYTYQIVAVEGGTRKYVGSIEPSTQFSKETLLGAK
jgi:branched-chain amino acid transport system substrate-binding protein